MPSCRSLKRTMTPLWTLLLCSLLLCLATPAWAQDDDMSFGEDDVEDDYSFSEDEVTQEPAEGSDSGALKTTGGRSIAVVAPPMASYTEGQRQQLQTALDNAMQLVGDKYDVEPGSPVLSGLQERAEDCSREMLCLASVGKEAGVNKILMARVTQLGEGNYRLDVDLFDVDDRLFLNSRSYENLGDFDEATENVEPAVRYIFEIRTRDQGPVVETETNDGIIQPLFAYTTAGLAVLSLAGGIYFGLEASDQRDEIIAREQRSDGVYGQTQRTARDDLDEASNTASTANIFYGAAVGLGALSAVLFLVDFGSDVASEDELNDRRRRTRSSLRDLHIMPSVSTDSAGVGASFRF